MPAVGGVYLVRRRSLDPDESISLSALLALLHVYKDIGNNLPSE